MKRFPSIKKNHRFQEIYRKGQVHADRNFVMILLKNGNSESRLGISCSKKIGNSVVRHTMARKLREIFRLHKDELAVGVDIVVVVRNGARGISYQELEKSFLSLCRRHHIAETKSGG